MLSEIIDGGKTFADASIIRDLNITVAPFHWNVEIDADEHAFATNIKVPNGKFVHHSCLLAAPVA